MSASFKELEKRFTKLDKNIKLARQKLEEQFEKNDLPEIIENKLTEYSQATYLNEAREVFLKENIDHRNNLLECVNKNIRITSLLSFNIIYHFSLKEFYVDTFLKYKNDFDCYKKFKYLHLISLFNYELDKAYADRDEYNILLLNRNKLLIQAKTKNELFTLSIKTQTVINKKTIPDEYLCNYTVYKSFIFERVTAKASKNMEPTRINVYDEHLNLIRSKSIDEKTYANIISLSNNELTYWSDKNEHYKVLDFNTLEETDFFGQFKNENEPFFINSGPVEYVSNDRVYIRCYLTIDLLSRETGKLVCSVKRDLSSFIRFAVDSNSNLYLVNQEFIECYDLNGNIKFRTKYSFPNKCIYFQLTNDDLINFVFYDNKCICFI